MYEIKKNVNVPEKSNRGRKRIFPFDACEIGDGFEVPFEKRGSCSSSLNNWKATGGVGQQWLSRRTETGTVVYKRVK